MLRLSNLFHIEIFVLKIIKIKILLIFFFYSFSNSGGNQKEGTDEQALNLILTIGFYVWAAIAKTELDRIKIERVFACEIQWKFINIEEFSWRANINYFDRSYNLQSTIIFFSLPNVVSNASQIGDDFKKIHTKNFEHKKIQTKI